MARAKKEEEIKVLTLDDFNKVYDSMSDMHDDVEWSGLKLRIKKNITLQEMIRFVEHVSTYCFANENGEYMPEIKDFAVRCETLETYANIKLPEDIEERCKLVYCTDIYLTVISHVASEQYNALLMAVNKKVKHQAASNIEAVAHQINDIASKFTEIEEGISKLFDGIDADTINGIAGALANGKFDEDKLAKAVLAQRKERPVM